MMMLRNLKMQQLLFLVLLDLDFLSKGGVPLLENRRIKGRTYGELRIVSDLCLKFEFPLP